MAAPAIVSVANIMPVRGIIMPVDGAISQDLIYAAKNSFTRYSGYEVWKIYASN